MTARPTFLRVPPFPGGRSVAAPNAHMTGERATLADAATLADEIVRLRVGGAFWERQSTVPDGRDIVLQPSSPAMATEMLADLCAAGLTERAVALAPAAWCGAAIPCCDPRADPWHVAAQAPEIWTDADDDLALVAGLSGRAVRTFGAGRFAAMKDGDTTLSCLADELARTIDPFTGAPWPATEAIAQLGEWRALIEQNRMPKAIYGIARWKRVTMDALLWDGHGPVAYAGPRTGAPLVAGDTALAWRSRVAAPVLDELAQRGVLVGEIEDGMIRSQGLGANCVPPLSVIVDVDGVHFDPSRPSALERMLAEDTFPAALLARAAALRARLVATGLSKYGAVAPVPTQTSSGQRRVLVTGQVEDDRSILTGGAGMTNLTLLERARALEPDARITYRPHPDVEAGHRKGRIADADALRLADAVERDGPITAAIDAADALHVITSLAGFEALMRGKTVVTHGVPFFAGWGLTEDHAAVPARRGRARTIDELVAAVLIRYPRYLDPVTRLPCQVELLVERLAAGTATVSSPLVRLRTWQGKVQRWTGSLSATR